MLIKNIPDIEGKQRKQRDKQDSDNIRFRKTGTVSAFDVPDHSSILRLPFGNLFVHRYGHLVIVVISFIIFISLFYKVSLYNTFAFILFISISIIYFINSLYLVPLSLIGYGRCIKKDTWKIQMAPFAFVIYNRFKERRKFIIEELEICINTLKKAGVKKIVLITWLLTPELLSQSLSSPPPKYKKLGKGKSLLLGIKTQPFHYLANFIGKRKSKYTPLTSSWYEFEWDFSL